MINNALVIGIDASNIRDRGGLTQLKNFISGSSPYSHSFCRIYIWSSSATLNQLPDLPWLIKCTHPLIESNIIAYFFWHLFVFKRLLLANCVNVLYSPGGTYLTSFQPCVSMSRNLLPFQLREAFRYFPSLTFFRLLTLRYVQKISFDRSKRLIFLSEYAKLVVRSKCPLQVVIPHGVSSIFQYPDRVFAPIHEYSTGKPFCIVYVSSACPYKHHCNLVSAVSLLRQVYQLPLSLKLIGIKNPYPNKLDRIARVVDPRNQWLSILGPLPPEVLSSHYKTSDLGVFSSTCENLPNIILEMMSASLPIASSYYGPMLDLLPNGCFYDPLSVDSIIQALAQLVLNHSRRQRLGVDNHLRSSYYKCSSNIDAIHDQLRSSIDH